jgi:hypothetical protein
MSELINTGTAQAQGRLQLLGTASALALLVALPATAQEASASRPTVWIEGGYQFEGVTGSETLFHAPLEAVTRANGLPVLSDIASDLSLSRGAEGRITFQPKGSDWSLSLSGRFGRGHSVRKTYGEKEFVGPPMKWTINPSPTGFYYYDKTVSPVGTAYAEQRSETTESHAIVDFQVGRDVGVGILGRSTEVVVGFGARYAQFSRRGAASGHGAPDLEFENIKSPGLIVPYKYKIWVNNYASATRVERETNLHAIGPALSMNNTTRLFGDEEGGALNLDWGANASLLFGRQRAETSHQATAKVVPNLYGSAGNFGMTGNIAAAPITSRRSRTVTIPNLGGFAGLSYRFTNAKLSAGYRADFFFGAMDRGLDTAKSTTTGFHGPFATISVGL